jgi:hypothetical protein
MAWTSTITCYCIAHASDKTDVSSKRCVIKQIPVNRKLINVFTNCCALGTREEWHVRKIWWSILGLFHGNIFNCRLIDCNASSGRTYIWLMNEIGCERKRPLSILKYGNSICCEKMRIIMINAVRITVLWFQTAGTIANNSEFKGSRNISYKVEDSLFSKHGN